MELRNKSKYEFTDISTEEYRTYTFKDGVEIVINKPLYLGVSSTGHRILDAEGISRYVFLADVRLISWRVKEGQPHFVK